MTAGENAPSVDRSDIDAAAERIRGHVRRTPAIDLGRLLSERFRTVLKLEHLQVTGSFKPRGAFSLLTSIEAPEAGLVVASGGNFGMACAYAAGRLGTKATVFVPETSPQEKIGRIERYGAEVRVIPGFYDEAMSAATGFAEESGAFQAHAYDQREVVAGQGTMARELADQVDHVGAIVAAVGGGGLIGGIASWCRDDVAVVASEPEKCSSLHSSLKAGRRVEVDVGGVAVSSLGARSVGEHAWHARRWIDESVLVSDEAIVEAQRWLWSELRVAVEPAAATPVAALRTGAFRPDRDTGVVVVLSGANLDPGSVA